MVQGNKDVSMANKKRYNEEKETLSEGDDVEPNIASIHPNLNNPVLITNKPNNLKIEEEKSPDKFGT